MSRSGHGHQKVLRPMIRPMLLGSQVLIQEKFATALRVIEVRPLMIIE